MQNWADKPVHKTLMNIWYIYQLRWRGTEITPPSNTCHLCITKVTIVSMSSCNFCSSPCVPFHWFNCYASFKLSVSTSFKYLVILKHAYTCVIFNRLLLVLWFCAYVIQVKCISLIIVSLAKEIYTDLLRLLLAMYATYKKILL